MSETLAVFETLSSKQPYPVKPASLLGGNNTVIMADPRKGKSYTAAKICEQLCQVGVPFIIVDPDGEYYSLREKFSVLVIGIEKLENCDVSAGPEHAELLVDQFLESTVPMIFDLSSPDVEEDHIHNFLAKFMKYLIQEEARARIPCLAVLDEADESIPERGHKSRGPDYDQFSKLVKKGGKRGIGTIIISHRPSWVAKDLLAKSQNWILMSQKYKDDLQRLEDLSRIPLDTLMKLKARDVGEALLYGAITDDQLVWVRCLERETTHIGTTPTVRPKFVKRPELENLLVGFRDEVERLTTRREAERTEIDRLQAQIRQLQLDLEDSQTVVERLRTAKEAAKMIEVPRQPSVTIESALGPSLEEHEKLRGRIRDLERQLQEMRSGEVTFRQVVPFTIDDYGNIRSEFPWLVRLIDLSRVKAVIVKHLMENSGGCTAESIALSYGFSPGTIRDHLNDLHKKSVVKRTDFRPHKYSLRKT